MPLIFVLFCILFRLKIPLPATRPLPRPQKCFPRPAGYAADPRGNRARRGSGCSGSRPPCRYGLWSEQSARRPDTWQHAPEKTADRRALPVPA